MRPAEQSAPTDHAPQTQLPSVSVNLENLAGLRWDALFGNDGPVELEIGVGKGTFLLRRSRENPHINFFGIEWANEFYRFAVDRMQRWKVENVRLLRADAAHFVKLLCPRSSLTVMHVYHPDPWPKKRHHKRRLFQAPFVAAATECLIPGGRLAVQTDHAEYFEQIAAVLRAQAGLREVDFDDPRFGVRGGRMETNFEVKYVREGRALHRIAMERSDGSE